MKYSKFYYMTFKIYRKFTKVGKHKKASVQCDAVTTQTEQLETEEPQPKRNEPKTSQTGLHGSERHDQSDTYLQAV